MRTLRSLADLAKKNKRKEKSHNRIVEILKRHKELNDLSKGNRHKKKKFHKKQGGGDNEPEVIGAAAVEDDFYCDENRALNKSTTFDPSRLEKAASLISTVGNWPLAAFPSTLKLCKT